MTPTLRGSVSPIPGTPASQNTLEATSLTSTEVGDIILVTTFQGLGAASGSSLTIRDGYTQLVNHFHDDGNADGALGVAWIVATQAGAQTYQAFNSSSQTTDARTALRIYQAGTVDTSGFLIGSAASLTDGNLPPDPANVTGLSSSRDYAIEAIGGWRCNAGTINVTPTAPSGFGNLIETDSAGWLELALANKSVSGVTSSDPGAFGDNVTGTSITGTVSCTIAILGSVRRGKIGWTELSVDEANTRRGKISHSSFEAPAGTTRAGVIAQTELLVGDYNFPSEIKLLFHKTWARYRYVANNPTPVTTRRGIIRQTQLEVPLQQRRSVISHTQLETPISTQIAVGARTVPEPQTAEPAYTASIGRHPDVNADYAHGNSTGGANGNWGWLTNLNLTTGHLDNYNSWYATRTRRLDLALGMCPWIGAAGDKSTTGALLPEVAAGTHDAKFTSAANQLANTYPNLVNRPIYIRLGWEMDASGWPYSVIDPNTFAPVATKVANYKAAWRQIVTVMRAAQPSLDMRFVFCPLHHAYIRTNMGTTFLNAIWPGDDVVDLIGSDHYDTTSSAPGFSGGYTTAHPPTATEKQNACENYHTPALDAMNTFAVAHGKRQFMGEWGIWHRITSNTQGGDDNPLFIQTIYDWVTTHDFEYVVYFNRNTSSIEHSLTDFGTLSKANSRATFLNTFAQLPHPY